MLGNRTSLKTMRIISPAMQLSLKNTQKAIQKKKQHMKKLQNHVLGFKGQECYDKSSSIGWADVIIFMPHMVNLLMKILLLLKSLMIFPGIKFL
jgi:hypothetical protein